MGGQGRQTPCPVTEAPARELVLKCLQGDPTVYRVRFQEAEKSLTGTGSSPAPAYAASSILGTFV